MTAVLTVLVVLMALAISLAAASVRVLREYERGFMALGAPEGDTNTGLAYAGPVQWFMAGSGPLGGAHTDSFESGSRMQHRELLAT